MSAGANGFRAMGTAEEVYWVAVSGDLQLRCIAGAREGSVFYRIEKFSGRMSITLTAAEFHDLMYAGRGARRPSLSPS